MSKELDPVTPRHFAYIAEHARGDDAFLGALKQAAEAAGIPRIWISPAQAAFQQVLLQAAGARRVVEVGTLAGYSAIAMARALPADGLLETIELDPRHADFAAAWIARSDVAGRVRLHRGSGAEVLARLPAGAYDAAFLDADKASNPHYLREALRLLRPGGLVLVDNAFAFGQLFDERPTDREAPAVKAFNDLMARTPGVQAVILPLGDGLWVGVKQRDA